MVIKISLKLLVLLLFLFTVNAHAQKVDELSDSEIQELMQKAQQSGMSEEQIIAAAQANGYSMADILKVKARITSQSEKKVVTPKATQTRSVDSTEIKLLEEKEKPRIIDEEVVKRRAKIFGLNIFDNQMLNFEPNLRIPAPKNYILGTGDELNVDITGYAVAHYNVKVNEEGTISIENLNPIFVNGQTIDQAKTKITQRLKSIFGGVGGNGLTVNVTLSKIRSIKVNVIGQAVFPGSYTIPSLATAFNVLYAAGGPTEIGSLRQIEIFRGGKQIRKLDLYDYLLKGDTNNDIVLHDQDVILIPYVDLRVSILGEVRNPKMYELKKGDNLTNLLGYAGGANEKAYSKAVRVDRMGVVEKRILTVFYDEFNNFPLQKGDIVTVDSLLDRFENKISVEGAVYKPGDYELEKGMTLKKLIDQAEGLKPDAFMERGLLWRDTPNGDRQLIPVDLVKVLNGTENDIFLQKNDYLNVKSIDQTREKRTIQIYGEVNNPRTLTFYENVTVGDMVLIAGGFKYGANSSRIEIARRILEDKGDLTQNIQIIQIEIDPKLGINEQDKKMVLKPFDKIYVRKLARYEEQKIVTIKGEVNYPGSYPMVDKKERISDLIEKAGGLKSKADILSAKLIRNKLQMGIDFERILKDKNDIQNIILVSGDSLEIPVRKETVTIIGYVYNPTSVPYQSQLNLRDYLSFAGGASDSAFLKKIYVKYGSGRYRKTKSFMGIKIYPKIQNGSEIYVPIHKKHEWTPAERITFSTAMASLATILLTLIRTL